MDLFSRYVQQLNTELTSFIVMTSPMTRQYTKCLICPRCYLYIVQHIPIPGPQINIFLIIILADSIPADTQTNIQLQFQQAIRLSYSKKRQIKMCLTEFFVCSLNQQI